MIVDFHPPVVMWIQRFSHHCTMLEILLQQSPTHDTAVSLRRQYGGSLPPFARSYHVK